MSDRERRKKTRYPLQLSVYYQSASSRILVSGAGRTLNISSGGLLIASPQPVCEGIRLRLKLVWPCALDDLTPLQLIADSTVVRSSASQFAVTLARYQFRTSRRAGAPADPLLWASATA